MKSFISGSKTIKIIIKVLAPPVLLQELHQGSIEAPQVLYIETILIFIIF